MRIPLPFAPRPTGHAKGGQVSVDNGSGCLTGANSGPRRPCLHLPSQVIDRRARPKIRDAVQGTMVTLEVTVDRHRPPPPRNARAPYLVHASDDTGDVVLTFFRAKPGYVEKLLPVVMKAKPQAILFEAANPRHAHEWQVFRDMIAMVPQDKILVPGVLSTTTNYVEHPRLVAERLERFAEIVGRERVIAGTDCGFGTFAGFGPVDPDIVWMKLKSLVDGAELASRRLWAR